MNSCAQTDVGKVRKINQDAVFASEDSVGILPNLFLVADGMGGHKAGDFASSFAVRYMVSLAGETREKSAVAALRTIIEQTNTLLFEQSIRSPELEGMGTTLVAAFVENQILYVANVGDSRLYLLRDRLEQITRDHSYVEEMVSLGKIERGSEAYRSQKNIITRAVGIGPVVEPDLFEIPLECGDLILLCSDGLTNMVGDEEICTILKADGTLEEKADVLIRRANENGGKDNIAVVLLKPQISEVSL